MKDFDDDDDDEGGLSMEDKDNTPDEEAQEIPEEEEKIENEDGAAHTDENFLHSNALQKTNAQLPEDLERGKKEEKKENKTVSILFNASIVEPECRRVLRPLPRIVWMDSDRVA